MSVNTLKEKVEEYLELLKAIKQKTGDERTALAILQEVNKDVRMDRISFERGNGKDNGSPRNHTRMVTLVPAWTQSRRPLHTASTSFAYKRNLDTTAHSVKTAYIYCENT